jgi:integrase/recombinase XerD
MSAVSVRELTSRPSRHGANVVSMDSRAGLSNATIQQRLVPVRLFYDHLIEEGLRESNPVGRGKYTPGRRFGGQERGLVPRLVKLPWIPDEQQWWQVLAVAASEPVRNRVMLALAYDAALRREELCLLDSEDLDSGHRTLRIKAEHTKNRLERVVPYSAPTGVLQADYLVRRATISRARGPLFLSESHRNYGQPVTLWTWSKVIRRIAVTAGVPRFSTHTTRHLCLTDLARMGWELHAIATFAGHRSTESTLTYIHLSGRDLVGKLNTACSTSTAGGSRCWLASPSRPRSRADSDRDIIRRPPAAARPHIPSGRGRLSRAATSGRESCRRSSCTDCARSGWMCCDAVRLVTRIHRPGGRSGGSPSRLTMCSLPCTGTRIPVTSTDSPATRPRSY